MLDQADSTTRSKAQKAGKYLTFTLADEEYGVGIFNVRELIGVMDITAVPRTPRHVKGVIDLRGKVIPVVDLRLKLGLPEGERRDENCIIVLDISGGQMGLLVDSVSEVLDVSEDDVQDTPSFGANVDTQFILGMAKADDRVIILLDIEKVLERRAACQAGAPEADRNA